MGSNKRRKPIRQPGRKSRFSKAFVSSGKGPNQIEISRYADRAKSLAITPERLAYLDKVFPPHVKDDGTPYRGDPRMRAEDRKRELETEPPKERSVVLGKSTHYRMTMTFDDNGKFWFVEEFMRTRMVRKSFGFGTRDNAMRAFEQGSIHWEPLLPMEDT